MQTLLVHSAFWRGVSLFAGMLLGKIARDHVTSARPVRGDSLVSWCSEAHSRREDELARLRQSELH